MGPLYINRRRVGTSSSCVALLPFPTYVLGTMAPCLRSMFRMSFNGTSRGVAFMCEASAAVAPAAWPMAMHDACTRRPELASRSLDTHLPATMM